MEKNQVFLNKYNKVLWVFFIIIVLINIILASFALRTAFFDGAPRFIQIIDGISNGEYRFLGDITHPRHAVLFLNELPTHIAGFLFGVKDKFVLGFIDTFTHLFLPFLTLLWNYKLTKSSGKREIFAASLFLYCFFIMLYQIWPYVELSLCTMLLMLLYNYLCYRDKDYSKFDIFLIFLISIASFQSYEVIVFIAPLLYLTAIRTFGKTKDGMVRLVKFFTAVLIISAGIYNIWFMFNIPNEGGEIVRFLKEGVNIFRYFLFSSNVFLSVIGIILLFFCNIKKLFDKEIILFSIIIFGTLIYMICTPEKFVNPMVENSTRTLNSAIFPIVLLILVTADYLKKEFSDTFLSNLITVSILIGIAQNIWQINNTFWWNKNIENMKDKLVNNRTVLYFPENDPIFDNNKNYLMQRYISPFSYIATSIIFSESYEIKYILMQPENDGSVSGSGRKYVFVDEENNALEIPACRIKLKNFFWDLTSTANFLKKFNNKKFKQNDDKMFYNYTDKEKMLSDYLL